MYETVTTTAAGIRHNTSDFNSLRRSQMLSFSWMRSIIARAKNFITSGYRQKNNYDNNRMNFEGDNSFARVKPNRWGFIWVGSIDRFREISLHLKTKNLDEPQRIGRRMTGDGKSYTEA